MNAKVSYGNSPRSAVVSADANSRRNVREVEPPVRGSREGADVSRSNRGNTKRILVVEEEPLVRLAILSNLRRVGFAVDVAPNGSIALEKLRSGDPDAIFLDLMLPDIDGVEVIEEIRREPEYADLPIYVYSSAFPMKMSRRAAKAGATRIFDKLSTPLDEVAAEVALQLIGVRSINAEADAIQSDQTDSEVLKQIAAKLPESVGRLHRHVQELVRCKDNAARAAKCGELRSRVHLVVNYAILAGRYMARPAATLQSLLYALREKPRYATESSVRTISLAVEVIGLLCRNNAAGYGSQLSEFTAVVADDELTSRSVVGSALRSMGFKLNNFVDPTQALRHLQSHSTDLVLLKVGMREMGGFDLCKKLRSLPVHRKTPAILVGDTNDFESSKRAASCGESDLIITPFIFIELSLKAICLVLKNRLSNPFESGAITMPAPQAEEPAAGLQEERSIGAVSARQPVGVATGVRKSNATLYRTGEELKRRVQAASAEAATPREVPGEMRPERGESSARMRSDGVELDQLRTALEQERQQRQRLETKLQERAASQPTTSGARRMHDVWENWVPPATAATGAESNTAPDRASGGLKKQLHAASSDTAILREALETTQKDREELSARILSDRVELNQLRTALDRELQQRQQLETRLQEMTARLEKQVAAQAGLEPDLGEQLSAAKAAAEKAETASREKAQRSSRFEEELTALQQQRDELSGQLALAQQAAADAGQYSTGLETRLRETNEDLERAKTELEQERQQRQQPGFQEITARQAEPEEREQAEIERREPGNATETARREEDQQSDALEQELTTLREALEKKQKEREELSARIFSDGVELDQLRTTLEQERQQRQQLETTLQEITARQAEPEEREQAEIERREPGNATEEARREEDQQSDPLEQELTALQQQRDELSGQLALAQQAAADAGQHSSGLETRLHETNEDLERAKTELEQERQQRQQLEARLQEITARPEEREQAETERREPWNAAEPARPEEDQRNGRSEEELTTLQQERDELFGQLALAQQAAADAGQHSSGLETRLYETNEDLERAKTELEQERQQRQQLEARLQEITAHQAEPEKQGEEQAETERREPWNATEPVRPEEDQRNGRSEEERTTLQQERDELFGQLALAQQMVADAGQHSSGLETRLHETNEDLERAKTELEQERQQRQQLEARLQEITARPEEREQAETERREPWNAAEPARHEEHQLSDRFEEEPTTLQQERDELFSQLALAQQAAADAGQHSSGLETRLYETSEDLERAKTELEQERQQRQQLEARLQEITASPEEREQAETEHPRNATEAARGEEIQLSDRFEQELTTLQQERDELFSQLAQAQSAAAESKARTEELENQLRESTSETARARAERGHLESELSEQLTAAKAAAEKAEAGRQEEAQRTKRFEEELTTLQQQRDELGGKLAAEQQATGESRKRGEALETRLAGLLRVCEELNGKLAAEQQATGESNRRSEELENRLRESTAETERAKTECSRLESDLGGQLKAANAATEKAEAARRDEAQRSKRFEEELTTLQQQRDELGNKLAAEQQATGESKRRSEELENRLRESTGEIERAKTERSRLESELGGQLTAAKAAAEKAETASREEAQRSKRFEEELTTLQQQHNEVSNQLAMAQSAATESKARTEDLENRLRESTGEIERAKVERSRLESELGGQLTAAKATAEKAEAARQEEAQQSKRFEEELTTLKQQHNEVSNQLAMAQSAAAESKGKTEDLENRLRESTGEIERTKAERSRLESELGGQLTAAKAAAEKAEAARQGEAQRNKRFEQELRSLQQQHGELSNQLAAAQSAAAESKGKTEDLENRLRESTGEIERAKAERSRLESELGGQLTAAKATAEKAEAARQGEAQRSKRFEEELGSLKQQRDELSNKLATEQQTTGESRKRGEALETRLAGLLRVCEELKGKLATEQEAIRSSRRTAEELENGLKERTEQLEHAKTELEQQAADRARLESELGEQLKTANAAAEKAEAARQEEAQRGKRFEEELTTLQKQRDELGNKLAAEQRAAGESKRRSEELENRLRESTTETERAKAERSRLESELGGQLKAANAATEKVEAARREEAERSKRFEQELTALQKQRDELSNKLAAEQQATEASRRRSDELESGLRERTEALERAKAELEHHAADRARLDTELGEQLKVAKAAFQRAEEACRKRPSGPSKRS
jgi:DNA-binding response OmpR family regulator/chromosome segregation ATPase